MPPSYHPQTDLVKTLHVKKLFMILFSPWKVIDISSLTVEILSLCGGPTLLVATQSIGCTALHLTATGQPAAHRVLSSLPLDGPPAHR